MTKQYISVDSQLLNGIQKCARSAKYQFIENLHPSGLDGKQMKAPALEKGSLMHTCLEVYDGLKGNCCNFESETWLEIAGKEMPNGPQLYDLTTEQKIEFSIEASKIFASKMDLDSETATSVLYQFSEYCKFYSNDPWSTLAVEEVATRIMFEDDELQIIYSGKIDRVVEQGNIRAPMDHKTSERRSDPSSLSNQFIGYCWILGMQNIVIDKIGFQKTLKPTERFQRYILTIDDSRVQEWLENSIFWIRSWVENNLKKDHFPMNLTSCDKYGSCIYSSICESSPEGRDWKKERDYVLGDTWDVAKVLEEKV